MFRCLEADNELRMQELRGLTTSMLRASQRGQFKLVEELRRRRRRCLGELASALGSLSSAA